ncbi:hypothetical protein L1987_27521 [Smallanthus sonchifolius]|uniref:Uncharacterized protein n=1 Tax=Smallanthus sonchifolius TaxID=185202 RepID=A0ACB9IBD3_9ASTR|nr:hypothetical protein L1987_27521 [Smallanthus sonchifolius]
MNILDSRFIGLMANKSKQNQSIQRQVNDYETSRLLRVQENRKKMQDLGLKRIANSLTSLVDSQEMRNKKVKPTYINNTRDEEFMPDNDDNSQEDNQEVETSVEVSKKHRPRYIAPLSMNRIVNLAKKNRMTAPNASQKLQLDSNAKENNQCRSTISTGELISKTQRREKYDVPDAAKTWVLKSIGQSYKRMTVLQ